MVVSSDENDVLPVKEILSRSQLNAKFFDFLDENRLIFVVLSCRFQRLDRYFYLISTGAYQFDALLLLLTTVNFRTEKIYLFSFIFATVTNGLPTTYTYILIEFEEGRRKRKQ